MRGYKEDSTKGNARIMPTNYKGDVLVQSWVDARQLAMLSVWLDGNGYVTRHLSDLIKITVEEVVSKLIDSGMVSKVEFTGEARDLLVRKYRAKLNPSGRGERNLLHNLHLDELRRNTFKDEVNVRPVQGECYTAEERDRIMKHYNEVVEKEREEKLKRDIERQKKAAMASGKVVKVEGEGESNIDRQRKKIMSVKGYEDIIIDVEENVRRMKEYDEKLKDMP